MRNKILNFRFPKIVFSVAPFPRPTMYSVPSSQPPNQALLTNPFAKRTIGEQTLGQRESWPWNLILRKEVSEKIIENRVLDSIIRLRWEAHTFARLTVLHRAVFNVSRPPFGLVADLS